MDGNVGSDSNAGTSPGSGNAWATVGAALATIVAGDVCYVKASAVYSISSGLTASTGTSDFSAKKRIVGYTSTPGDGGRATIRATAAITGLSVTATGWQFENLDLDGDGVGGTGVSWTDGYGVVLANCLIRDWLDEGYSADGAGGGGGLFGCEVTGCASTSDQAVYLLTTITSLAVQGCRIHGNGGHGITNGIATGNDTRFHPIVDCLIYGNDGHGVSMAEWAICVLGCTIDDNTGDGIHLLRLSLTAGIRNNIFTRNGGYGLDMPDASGANLAVDYNWFGSGSLANTSGARNGIAAGPHDLTGDPQYADSGSGDYTPTNPAVRASSSNGWVGAVQPTPSAGGMLYLPNCEGT